MRREILGTFEHLPEMVEYMNRATFTTAEKYAKDVALAIKYLGTERLPKAYALKAKAEYLLNKIPFLPKYLPDIFLYYASKLFPQHLPKRLLKYRDTYEHLLILVTADEAIDEARRYLEKNWNQTALVLPELGSGIRISTNALLKRCCHSTLHCSVMTQSGLKISLSNSPRTWCWIYPMDTICATCFTISTCIVREPIWNGSRRSCSSGSRLEEPSFRQSTTSAICTKQSRSSRSSISSLIRLTHSIQVSEKQARNGSDSP